jgi:hypothetical protein
MNHLRLLKIDRSRGPGNARQRLDLVDCPGSTAVFPALEGAVDPVNEPQDG